MSTAEAPCAPPEGHDAAYAVFPKDRRTTVSDGTPIAWTLLPPAPDAVPRHPIVTANGWSCSDVYWAYLAPALAAAGHPVLIVDPRGHGASGLPRCPRRGAANITAGDVAIERFALDLHEVADAAGLGDVVVMGHSMGVQVALEAHRARPERVVGLVLVAGSYENPLRTFWGLPVADLSFPFAHLAVSFAPELARLALQPLRLTDLAVLGAKVVRGIGPKARAEDLEPYFRHLASIDPAVMMKVIDALRNHSAAPHLRAIDAPTLILAAGHDSFTPPSCSRRMFERIPTAEIQWFPEAGHTLPIEEPDAIVGHVEEWYRRQVQRDG